MDSRSHGVSDDGTPRLSAHLENVAANLQLVADLAYADFALAAPDASGRLVVVADARPATALAPVASSRVGARLDEREEPEAYHALATGQPAESGRRRVVRGITFTTTGFPVGEGASPTGVLLRNIAEQVTLAPGRMETAFMDAAEELVDVLRAAPLLDVRDSSAFSTVRRAGDGVLRVSATGRVSYASPNAVNIMRIAGADGRVTDMQASALPGGGFAISPVLGTTGAIAVEAEVVDRVLGYRSIALPDGALVLVEDLTEARRRDDEIKVKEATIREVHHRVKNNLQTIASLLRIQARRTPSEDARHALGEAIERVSSMVVVHDMLASSDEERVDFAEAARTIAALVGRGLSGDDTRVRLQVSGSTGQIDAPLATSLSLVVAELVHNAIEHGFPNDRQGGVEVTLRRGGDELVLTVRDDGVGLPDGFDPESSANLGLAIVRTVIEDDLRGTITYSGVRGATVTVRVPVRDE
ncbi:MAG: histidine kinase N-terminal domain-containing protein [Coriobacteriia bacterium]|nr:histidine kinase N-terminal domain-containing protein [Coriobacteriia bacterium]